MRWHITSAVVRRSQHTATTNTVIGHLADFHNQSTMRGYVTAVHSCLLVPSIRGMLSFPCFPLGMSCLFVGFYFAYLSRLRTGCLKAFPQEFFDSCHFCSQSTVSRRSVAQSSDAWVYYYLLLLLLGCIAVLHTQMRPVVTDWRLKRSRCRLDWGLWWDQGTMY